jgi:hypothetical protein
MTYRFALVVGIGVLLFAAVAQAQSKAELFGGYQYTRPDGGPNLNGWNGALTGNFNQTFGITADFSGSYGSGLNFYTYTFGPKLGADLPVVKPFVHALFGGARVSGGGGDANGFDMMLGRGLDAGHGHLAWRVVQADWMLVRFSGVTDKKNVRVSPDWCCGSSGNGIS